MHCPRCGQQQISEDTRFCSRCGFALALVSEILLHGGTLPQLASLNEGGEGKKLITRNNGLKFGLMWFLVATFLLTPIAAIAEADELAAIFAVFGFIGGFLIMILSLLFLDKPAKAFQSDSPYRTADYSGAIGAPTRQNALPPQQAQPAMAATVQDFVPPAPAVVGAWKAPATSELAGRRPHSVTDGTTKLLQKDE